MSGELVFAVEGPLAQPADPVTLAEAGLKERSDLQEWVLAHPDILGEGVLVIAFEFDSWRASASGDRERDRLDVLGLDTDGRLVVAELKRDRAPETVNMQAIKYAAMTSRFTEETLIEHYVRFKVRAGEPVSEEQAREELIAHAGELDPEALRTPRIVLVAGSFPATVTATVVWLTEVGLDITMQKVQAYRVFGDRIVVTVSQHFPVQDVEDFTISPQRAQVKVTEQRRRTTREKSTVHKLAASKIIPDGTVLTLRPNNEVTGEIRKALEDWVAEDPRRGRAVWFNRVRDPLQWEFDGETYRPSPLVARMLTEAADVTRSPRGPSWWTLPDGRDLTTAAGSVAGGAFDWSTLHSLMAALPVGKWTTYGDLAELVGTAAQPLGLHISKCQDCANAHRVLGADGRVRPNFAWSDPSDQRKPEDLLRDEGIEVRDGVASALNRLTRTELLEVRSHDGE